MNETALPQKQDIDRINRNLEAIIQLLEKVVVLLRDKDATNEG